MGHFSVLLLSPTGGQPLWLTETRSQGDNILGRVASAAGDPSLVGQWHETSQKNILDWLFVHNYRLIGAASFRLDVERAMEFVYCLANLTQGTPNRPEPSDENWNFYERIIKFCLPLNEELREGPVFELFDSIGNHEQVAVREFLSDSNLINEPCEVVVWRIANVHRTTLSPLLYAIKCGNEATAVELIEAGAHLDFCDDSGMTALHYAVSDPTYPNLVKLLVKKGASLTARNGIGLTPFDFAVGGKPECTRIMIKAGADVNEYHHFVCPETSFEEVVSPVLPGSLDLECAKILAQAGANFNVENLEGETPLHIASINGKYDLAEFLITQGCDPSARTNKGETPASLALEYHEDSGTAIQFAHYCENRRK